jgi:hypothetical protein
MWSLTALVTHDLFKKYKALFYIKFGLRPLQVLAFLSVFGWLLYDTLPNITLKRDAPFRGGFEGLYFFQLRWLR